MTSSSHESTNDHSLKFSQLLRLGPANNDSFVAWRMGIGTLAPLIVIVAAGRFDLAPFAVFGAFVGVYSRVPSHLDRLLMQVKSAALMWAVILLAWVAGATTTLGESTRSGLWRLVAYTTIVAGLAAVIAGYFRLRPAGSLFHIFAFAAIASMADRPPLAEGMFTTTSVMVLGLILGQLGRVLPSRRTEWQVSPTQPLTSSIRVTFWVNGLAYVIASGVAGTIAAFLTTPLNMNHVYWAMVSAVVPLAGHTTRHGMARAVHRVLGTILGVGFMALIVFAQPPAWAAMLIIGVAQFVTELLVTRNYFWASAFITILSLVGTTLGHTMSASILYDRFAETVIGVSVGVVVAWLVNRLQNQR